MFQIKTKKTKLKKKRQKIITTKTNKKRQLY